VKTTSDITRGFKSSMKSATRPPSVRRAAGSLRMERSLTVRPRYRTRGSSS
jgi:hypothetical protein